MAELNRIAGRHLARVVENTDVGDSPDSPSLRNRWDRSTAVKVGDGYTAEVFNPLEYASFYEYGHRQRVGRVVFIELRAGMRKYGQVSKQQKSGKWGIFLRLTRPYAAGRYVLTSSESKAQQDLNAAAQNVLNRLEAMLK